MARKKRTDTPAIYKPDPKQEFEYAMQNAVEKAVLNHPQTHKLRKSIEGEMRKATRVTATPDKKKK